MKTRYYPNGEITVNQGDFQTRCDHWTHHCFGSEVARDPAERNHRMLEETLELVQSLGCSKEEAHEAVEYVFDRSAGSPMQEIGGVVLCLMALANAHNFDVNMCSEAELARCWTKAETIREKRKAKPKFKLKAKFPVDGQGFPPTDAERALQQQVDKLRKRIGICPTCLEEYTHDCDEPFANCKCGTTEWAFINVSEQPLAIQAQCLAYTVKCLRDEAASRVTRDRANKEYRAELVNLRIIARNLAGKVKSCLRTMAECAQISYDTARARCVPLADFTAYWNKYVKYVKTTEDYTPPVVVDMGLGLGLTNAAAVPPVHPRDECAAEVEQSNGETLHRVD